MLYTSNYILFIYYIDGKGVVTVRRKYGNG